MHDLSPKQLNRLFNLFGSLRDGVITEQEFSELSSLLDSSAAAQEYYVDYICLCTDLDTLQSSLKSVQSVKNATGKQDFMIDLLNPQLDLDMLRIWADYERTAEALELPKTNAPELVQVQKLPIKPVSRKVSKLTVGTLIGSIAALLFLLSYVLLNPRYSLDVATVSNAVDAEWSSNLPLQRGTRLAISSSDPIQLHKGFVEIQSDNNVTLTLEAPAEFRFVSADEIQVTYGQLFATVAPEGRGFSVQTPNSKIIDLGTRFGVFADLRGKTELHVFKGKTILIAGQKSQDKKTVEVSGGQACRVDAHTNDVANIDLNQNMFAQGIDPQSSFVITGGQRIDLADIIGGGDGTGNGTSNKGLKWDGTSLVSTSDMQMQDNADFPGSYVNVTCNPLIDGVFVPYGKGEEPLVLTSDTETLNLDDFIASDTNGLLTLMLIKQVTDDNAASWFCSKEAAGDAPEKYPTLEFPHASARGPQRITTAYKHGADAYVSNDQLRSPRQRLGQWPALSCRYSEDQRVKIIYLRFDISDVKGDLRDAVLNLYLDFSNRYRDLNVYGLVDGPADDWDEDGICYKTAPGLLDAELGRYELEQAVLTPLGTFAVVDNRIDTIPIQVASDQTCLWTAPTTRPQSVGMISNAANYVNEQGTRQSLMLDGVSETRTNPSIFMHANAGVTFDLAAIRREYGPVSIESFTAICGISKPSVQEDSDQTKVGSLASFYVLVDGREVFNAIDISPIDAPQAIDIKLNPKARYLTLIVSQGTDNSITGDACLFINPSLNLK